MFRYIEGQLHCEAVRMRDIARGAGTPTFVYSATSIREAYRDYDFAFGELPHTICYAVKANSTLAVLRLLVELGAGFDIVSGGELYRVLQAGADPAKVVFSGVGKTAHEIEYALAKGIHSFNCESESELAVLDEIACRLDLQARFALRINPDVDASTHPYISTGLTEHKFGIGIQHAEAVYARSRHYRNISAEGISCHIGSQMLDPAPMVEAAEKILDLASRLSEQGHDLRHLDLGGGLGIAYLPEDAAPDKKQFLDPLRNRLAASGLTVLIEPGRSIVGQAGMLLTEVLYRKSNGAKQFVIVDAAMNDLIRPALYQSHHEILPVDRSDDISIVDVVGPVCESGDFFARGRAVAGAKVGDYMAIAAAGAYGFVQSSNYNSRPRAAEVVVDGNAWRIVRSRETYADLVRGERI
jgi:diaminopimelate decarboxylase